MNKLSPYRVAEIADDPDMSTVEKLEMTGAADMAEMREMRRGVPIGSQLVPVDPVAEVDASPGYSSMVSAASDDLYVNPMRQYRFRGRLRALYGRTEVQTDKFNYCYQFGGPQGLGFLHRGLKLKAALACTGFKNVVKGNDRSKSFYDNFSRTFALRNKLYQLFYSLMQSDNSIVYWRKPPEDPYGDAILEFTVKPVKDVIVEYIGAQNEITDDGNLVYLKINQEHKNKILAYARGTMAERKMAQDFARQYPKLWAVYNGRPEARSSMAGVDRYMLSNKDGEYWAIINTDSDGCGFQDPSMETIFDDIEIWKSLQQGDLVIASIIAKLLVLVKAGETLPNTSVQPGSAAPKGLPNAGWAQAKDLNELKTHFVKRYGDLKYLFTRHNVDVKHIFPEAAILGKEKYAQALFNIFAWLCVSRQFMTGEEGSYQAGEMNRIGLTADLDTIREICGDQFVRKVYEHPTININHYREMPKIQFNRGVLRSARELRADQVHRYWLGESNTSLLEDWEKDIESQMAQRKDERDKYDDLLLPLVDFVNLPTSGRPAGEDSPDAEPAPRVEK